MVRGRVESQAARPIGTYNLHRYDAEKRQALDHWSRRVEAIVANAPGARVLPFAKFALPDRM